MSQSTDEIGKDRRSRPIRWLVYLILLSALIAQLFRIYTVVSKDGKTPFLSANDRSRWCTINALVHDRTYAIEQIIFSNPELTKRNHWYTIDLVKHRGADGQQHYYSSKPTLLPTMYGFVYWVVNKTTGWDLNEETFEAGRVVLVIVNWLPLGLFWFFMMNWFIFQRRDSLSSVHVFLNSNWSLMVMAVVMAWGTYLFTFGNTLNNHLPAAISVGVSLWCLEKIAVQKDTRGRWFVLCGLATSFGAANELPALSWLAAAGIILLICDSFKTITAYVPSLLPVALGFFGTNVVAHGELAPAYAHRGLGAALCHFALPKNADSDLLKNPDVAIKGLVDGGIECSSLCLLREARRDGRYEVFDPLDERQYALEVEERTVFAYVWDDWYDYPFSYWAGRQQGVDKGEPDRAKYAFHCLVGHHGILSLTPFWLLIPIGSLLVIHQRASWNPLKDKRLLLLGAMLATSAVVIAFYLARGLEDRNYGGVSSGLRWTFWLIPFWIWICMFALRSAQSFWARRCIEVLVLASVYSACYPWENPWTTPWLVQWFE